MARRRPFPTTGILIVFMLLVVSAAAAQSSGDAVPRTADGRPDLGGVWDFRTVTALERPARFEGRAFLEPDEVADFEAAAVRARNADLNRRREVTDRQVVNGTTETADLRLAYNDFWWDRGTRAVATRRTSLIVEPADGRMPRFTAAARQRMAARTVQSQRVAEGPEDRSLPERCILGFNSGPPMLPGGYNQNVQIFQTPDHVVFLNEMVHNARIVPLDGRGHPGLRQWTGSSRGRWDGDTLVVETTDFLRETSFRGSSRNLQLIERFTRVDAENLLYQFTVTDPTTWERPWTVEVPMRRATEPIYEYACHEGNYGMVGTLTGARAVEGTDHEAFASVRR